MAPGQMTASAVSEDASVDRDRRSPPAAAAAREAIVDLLSLEAY